MQRLWVLILGLAFASSQGGCIFFVPKQLMPILPCGEPSVRYDDAWRQEAESANRREQYSSGSISPRYRGSNKSSRDQPAALRRSSAAALHA